MFIFKLTAWHSKLELWSRILKKGALSRHYPHLHGHFEMHLAILRCIWPSTEYAVSFAPRVLSISRGRAGRPVFFPCVHPAKRQGNRLLRLFLPFSRKLQFRLHSFMPNMINMTVLDRTLEFLKVCSDDFWLKWIAPAPSDVKAWCFVKLEIFECFEHFSLCFAGN